MGGLIDGLVLLDGPQSWLRERGHSLIPLDVDPFCFVPGARIEGVTRDGDDLVPGFLELTAGLTEEAVEASSRGPVLYIHMEFHGGEGTHDAIGWRDGEVAFGPRFTRTPREAAGDPYVAAQVGRDMAINSGLRWLGVVAAAGKDEYATVGLDRHRWNSEWIAAATH